MVLVSDGDNTLSRLNPKSYSNHSNHNNGNNCRNPTQHPHTTTTNQPLPVSRHRHFALASTVHVFIVPDTCNPAWPTNDPEGVACFAMTPDDDCEYPERQP